MHLLSQIQLDNLEQFAAAVTELKEQQWYFTEEDKMALQHVRQNNPVVLKFIIAMLFDCEAYDVALPQDEQDSFRFMMSQAEKNGIVGVLESLYSNPINRED